MQTAASVIEHFDLIPHPEGGYCRQTWAADAPPGTRPSGTAILFLLPESQVSHWHRVDATEIWLFHAGAPLILRQSPNEVGPARADWLGTDIAAGQSPQLIVPPHFWQSARSTGDWTLVSCTVSPGFQFDGFTLAPQGFNIPDA